MLRAALPLAHGLGIDPALITCDATNMASRRVIERNGGILDASDGILRFWDPGSALTTSYRSRRTWSRAVRAREVWLLA